VSPTLHFDRALWSIADPEFARCPASSRFRLSTRFRRRSARSSPYSACPRLASRRRKRLASCPGPS